MNFLVNFVNSIKNVRKIILPLLIVYIIFFAAFNFPIQAGNAFSVIIILASLIIISILFCALFDNKILLIVCIYIFCNFTGLILHYFIEYRDTNVQKDFNILNIIVFLSFVIIVSTGSIIINRIISKSKSDNSN